MNLKRYIPGLSFLICILITIDAFSQTNPTYINVMMPTAGANKVNLANDIFLPSGGGGPYPVVLGRTPYDKTTQDDSSSIMLYDYIIDELTSYSIAAAIQDVRGRYASEGEEIAFIADAWGEDHDGSDTVKWIKEQTWSNGKVATIGASAGGITQVMLAGATTQDLAGQLIVVAPASGYHGVAYESGVFRYELVNAWLTGSQWPFDQNESMIRSQPLYGGHWKTMNIKEPGRAENIRWPVVIETGWYDIFLSGAIDLFTTFRSRSQNPDDIYIVIGPYTHGSFDKTTQGELTFPNGNMPYNTLIPHEIEYP